MATCGTGGWSGPVPGDPDNNITLSATAIFGGIEVSWSYPQINPEAVAHFELLRGTTNDRGIAVPHGVVAGTRYFDPLEVAETYYYWIRVVSVNGTVGDYIGPAFATGVPPAVSVLADLSGQIEATALAQSLRTQLDEIANTSTALLLEVQDRINGDSAWGAALNAVQDELTSAVTLVTAETQQRLDGQAALVTTIDGVAALNATNTAAISEEITARVTADDALSESISILRAEVDDPLTGLNTKATVATVAAAEASAIAASAQRSDIIQANLDLTNLAVTAASTAAATASGEASTAQTASALAIAEANAANALLTDIASDFKLTALEKQVVRTEWNAIANDKAKNNTQASLFSITTENTAFNTAFQALANYLNGGATWTSGIPLWINDANIGATQSIVRVSFRNAFQNYYNALIDLRNAITAAVKGLADTAQATADANAVILGLKASITYVDNAVVNEAGARALAIQALEASVSPAVTAAIQVEADVRASQVDGLYAQYTVKTDVGGLVSGYGLASSANNSAPTSAFGVQASQFFIAPPTVAQATAPTVGLYKGYVWRDTTANVTKYYTGTVWSTTPQALPFVVQATPTTVNGVAVPAGVYIDQAYVSSLEVNKLQAGAIAVGQFIQSSNYSANVSGWKINGDGTAEFSSVEVRGTVRANQTAFNTGTGFHLGSDGRFSVGNSAGNRMTWDGTNLNMVSPGFSLLDGVATFSGALNAATGSFSGSLSAATGTLGSLTINSGGHVKAGQSAFNSGVGFYLGYSGATPVFSLGNSGGARMFWNGTDLFINTPTFEAFTASNSGDISVGVGIGIATYGSRSAFPSGGKTPYTYSWVLERTSGANIVFVANSRSQTCTLSGIGDGTVNSGTLTCFVSDANGRMAMTSLNVSASHAASGG